ncbi:unnamed protein product [Hermetia illucens]|uniref:Uncharacterized protein n=1 Tax=Hermetia illucens TaxID=343691 RepID=A0A7R8YYM3_HERIL|nr:unnamed protein product [Hermetia illucens]
MQTASRTHQHPHRQQIVNIRGITVLLHHRRGIVEEAQLQDRQRLRPQEMMMVTGELNPKESTSIPTCIQMRIDLPREEIHIRKDYKALHQSVHYKPITAELS